MYNTILYFICIFRLIFIPPYSQSLTISSLLWSIAVDDYILKLITIIFKIIVIMMPIRLLPIIKRVRSLLYYCFHKLYIYIFVFREKYIYLLKPLLNCTGAVCPFNHGCIIC